MTWMGIGGIMTALGSVIMAVSIVLSTVTSFTPLPVTARLVAMGIAFGGSLVVIGVGIILTMHMINMKRRVDNV